MGGRVSSEKVTFFGGILAGFWCYKMGESGAICWLGLAGWCKIKGRLPKQTTFGLTDGTVRVVHG